MTATAPIDLLRPDLLEGVRLLVAGPSLPADALGGVSLAAGLREGCAGLGACVSVCEAQAEDEPAMDEALGVVLEAADAVGGALAQAGTASGAPAQAPGLDVLAVDGPGLFAEGLARGGSAHAALRNCLDASWNVTRAFVNCALLPAGRGGRIVYVAPRPAAGERAEAARAGLENLARTLSVEWARHEINAVTIAPGSEISASEVATLTAYLASAAGAYFSGCLLDLRGV